MKYLKYGSIFILGTGILYLIGSVFISQLGAPERDEVGAVSFHPNDDYFIVDHSQGISPLTDQQAASYLRQIILSNPDKNKLGIKFKRVGATVTLLVDLRNEVLEEQDSGDYGTRMQLTWKGNVMERIRRGEEEGNFEPPGLPPPAKKNLYH